MVLSQAVPDCESRIWYRTRTCNGILEVVIDSMKSMGTCEAMEEFSIYHFDYSALWDYVSLGLIEGLAKNLGIPPCDEGAVQIAHVYTRRCGVWVGCEYEVVPGTRECDRGYQPPYPEWEENGKLKVKVWKWQPCGETCCRRVIEFCKGPGLVRPSIIYARIVSKERLTECTGQADYDRPCEDGC